MSERDAARFLATVPAHLRERTKAAGLYLLALRGFNAAAKAEKDALEAAHAALGRARAASSAADRWSTTLNEAARFFGNSANEAESDPF